MLTHVFSLQIIVIQYRNVIKVTCYFTLTDLNDKCMEVIHILVKKHKCKFFFYYINV